MIKVSFAAPCVGVGGADGLMMELIKYSELTFTGIALPTVMPDDWLVYCDKYWPRKCPIYTLNRPGLPDYCVPCENHNDCIHRGTETSDIIITWCLAELPNYIMTQYGGLPRQPIVEYCQNTDKHAKYVVEANTKYITYKAACSQAAATCFGETDDVTVIYNGINPARITPRNGRQVQRAAWGIPNDVKVILYMGRFVEEKHPEIIISTVAQLPSNYCAILCGEGAMQPQLYDMAKALAPGRISFVKKSYMIGDLLAVADCFMLPSDFEGHPLALMEAMLAGKACVYSDLPVMQELESQFGPLGTMVIAGDSYAKAVLESLEEDNAFKRGNARAVIWDHFTISHIAAQWEEYLAACLYDWNTRQRISTLYPVTSKRKPLTRAT